MELEPDNISCTQCMEAKRGLTNRKRSYPYVKKSSLKRSMAEFQSIQQFWLQLDITGLMRLHARRSETGDVLP